MNTLIPGFEILYEQGPVIAVLKPAGVLTQAPPGIDSLETRIKRFLKTREEKPGNVYLATVHRLDRPVSGAMVFCKHVRAARKLSEQFEDRLVKKIYWVLVAGKPEQESGTWTDYLRKVPGEARSEVTDRTHPDGQLAILHYRTLKTTDAGSWLEITLETGRTHQIRLQASAHGHPVWGDALYGSTVTFGPPTVDERAKVIALHARTLDFRHPMTQEPVSLVAPLPEYWSVFPTGS